MPPSIQARLKRMRKADALVVTLWLVVSLVVIIRLAHSSGHHSLMTTYAGAGHRWIAGEPLYKGPRGFVYGPLVAAFFTPLAVLPQFFGTAVWIILDVGVYAAAVWAWLRTGLSPEISKERYWLLFLLLLPLSIGNFNNGQINPLVAGLIVLSLVAVRQRAMGLSALCVALCVYCKIYPVALGLVLAAIYFRGFSLRFAIALLALGLISFLLQRPSYVLHQYQLWFASRTADNRKLYALEIAPRDLWMVLRVLHITVSENIYTLIQVLSGAAVAVICWLGRYRYRWSEPRLFIAMLSLVCSWMLLCGPATESATYIILAPPVVIALLQGSAQGVPRWMSALAISSFILQFAGLGINALLKVERTIYVMSVQPIAALLFAFFALIWIFRDCSWPVEPLPPKTA